MTNRPIEDKLEIIIDALRLGADPEDIMRLFPDDREQLAPLLAAIGSAKKLSPPDPEGLAIQRSRSKLLVEADHLSDKQAKNFFGWRFPRLVFAVTLVVLILIFGAGGLLATSAQSLPGDQTYPLKLAVENLQLRLNSGQESRTVSQFRYDQRRIDEVQNLLDLQRLEPVFFSGVVEESKPEFWIIADILVKVNPETNLIGTITNGSFVEVKGSTTAEGWIAAHEIRLRTKEVFGILDELNAEYLVISGQQISINPQSQIDPRLIVGDQVVALVEASSNDRLWANAVIRLPSNGN